MRYLVANTSRDFIQEVERLGLSLSQIKTLHLMADAEPSTLGAMADDLGLSLPAVSRAVDGLHKRGLVKRVEDSVDRRAKRISLTAKGRRTFEGLLALRVAGLRAFVDGLDQDEREALAQGIEPLLRRPEISALANYGAR